MTFSLSRRVSIALVVCGPFACAKDDDPENVLPTQADSSGDSVSGSTDATVSATDSASSADTSADSSGGGTTFPRAYRFECVEIQILGDADGDALQAQVLENTWNSDIDNYKLNIVFELVSRDDAAGAGTVGIRSGIGTGAADLCSEATSESEIVDVAYDPDLTTWEPVETDEVCSGMAAPGTASGGTYTMTLPEDSVVYIYAQDTDGTTFNCTADTGLPDAVPVRAVEATLTASVDEQSVAGNLLGCLREDEAEALCSCLGMCSPEIMNENCGGCPNGSIPLRDLLGDINPSQRCTDLLGGNAYDIGLGFTASLLPSVPTTCG